jgi:hypothetical protein
MPRILIKPGTKYNYLTTLYDTRVNGIHYWVCRCECGNETRAQGQHLKSGRAKSCGCKPRSAKTEKIVGRTFGALTPVEALSNRNFLCNCKCGNQIKRSASVLYTNPACTCKQAEIRQKVKLLKDEILNKSYKLNKEGLTKAQIVEELKGEYKQVIVEKVLRSTKGFIQHKPRKRLHQKPMEGKAYGSLTVLNKVGDNKFLCHCSYCGNYMNLTTSVLHKKPQCSCDYRIARTKIKDIEDRILADIFRLNKEGFTIESIFDEIKDEYDIAFVKKVISEVSHLITN